MVRSVHSLLVKHRSVPLFKFVINPRSFGQTIENIFYLSFSIRDARARLEIDEDGMPIVSAVTENLTDEEIRMENKQCVLELTMPQWEVIPYFWGCANLVGIEKGVQYHGVYDST